MKLPNPTHLLHYIDKNGRYSERKITVDDVGLLKLGIYIDCYCHECREIRTFKIRNIVMLTDVTTGEVIIQNDKNEVIKKISPFMSITYEAKHNKHEFSQSDERKINAIAKVIIAAVLMVVLLPFLYFLYWLFNL